MMGDASRRWLLLASAAINLYLLGAACVLLAVAYPQLQDVAREQLPAFHAALTKKLPLAFILPEFVSFLSLLPLLAWRPAGVPAWPAWGAVVFGLAYFAITFAWHLPAHGLLAKGELSAYEPLMRSHVLRTATVALRCGLLLWMVAVAQRSERSSPLSA